MPAHDMQAILSAHRFKVHEVYDPAWHHVHVPEQFLSLICPMAEGQNIYFSHQSQYEIFDDLQVIGQ